MKKLARMARSLALAAAVAICLPAVANASPIADPNVIHFGNVPINTSVTQGVDISVDAGYRTEIASGSGINAPFSFGFDTCGAGGGFAGPGDCNVNSTFHPTGVGAFSGTVNVFECPVAGGSCIAATYAVDGTGVSVRGAAHALDFGSVPINTTVTLSVEITVDAGYRTELASGNGIDAPFSFSFASCGAGGGFSGPGTCTIEDSFTPTSIGPQSGTITVFECPIAGGSCLGINIPVSGVGVSVFAADGDVDFGDVLVGTHSTRQVGFTVDAGYRTEIASGTGINAPFSFGFDTCGAGGGFAGPGHCTVNQTYAPTTVGPNSGTTNLFECPIAGGQCIAAPVHVHGNGVNELVAAAPEPGGLALSGLIGTMGLVLARRSRRRNPPIG